MTTVLTLDPAITDAAISAAAITASQTITARSTEMYTMHEALAREHRRDLERSARRRALSRDAERRWRSLERPDRRTRR